MNVDIILKFAQLKEYQMLKTKFYANKIFMIESYRIDGLKGI